MTLTPLISLLERPSNSSLGQCFAKKYLLRTTIPNLDFDRAGALYHELVAAHPQDARLLLAYGNALSGAKQYKEARTQFDRAKVIGGLGARDRGLPAAKACALDHDPEAAAFAALRDRADLQALFHTH